MAPHARIPQGDFLRGEFGSLPPTGGRRLLGAALRSR
jgi:hypothetical protein